MKSTVPHTGPYDTDFDDPLFENDLDTYEPAPEERTSAVIAHLSGLLTILGPILVYFLKRDESAYVEDQAAEALNFQISIAIAATVFGILCMVLIGIPFLLATVVAALVMPFRAAMAANRGERYRYPFTIRLIK
jgi:uncharacterized Tic20 family protein